MFYSPWGRKTEVAFHDKAFERAALPPWDSRWHALSVAARAHFLDKVKAPARPGGYRPPTPSTRIPARVLDELAAAGFVEGQTRGARGRRHRRGSDPVRHPASGRAPLPPAGR